MITFSFRSAGESTSPSVAVVKARRTRPLAQVDFRHNTSRFSDGLRAVGDVTTHPARSFSVYVPSST